MKRNKSLAIKLIFSVLMSCTLIFTVIFTYNYFCSRKIIIKNIEYGAKNLASSTVNKIDTVIEPVEGVVESISYFLGHFLEHMPYNEDELLHLMKVIVNSNPEIYGSTISFEPYKFNGASLFFAPYYYKDKEKLKLIYLGNDEYDYFNMDWYRLPKELGHPVWTEPYFDEGGGEILMSTYSVPFYKETDTGKEFMGVITADISLAWLEELISSIKILDTGYGFLLSKKGLFVTHPGARQGSIGMPKNINLMTGSPGHALGDSHKDLVVNKTIFQFAEDLKNEDLKEIGKNMTDGKTGFLLSKSIFNEKKIWIVYAPLVSTGWSFGAVFPQDELMSDVFLLNKQVIIIGIIGFLLLLIVVILISNSITRPLRLLVKTTKDIAKGKLDFKLPVIKSKDEVGMLAESFVYMRDSLKKYIKELTQTTAVKERMESELNIAHDIQMSIVPKMFSVVPKNLEFDIYAILEPAREVGGDLYDFFFIDDEHFCFVVGDVSDKGVPASLFMAVTATLVKTIAKENRDPAEILRRVNNELSHDNESCMFVTFFCCILNIKTGKVSYSNAGHNAPLIARKKGRVEYLGNAVEAPLGVQEGIKYKNEQLTLEQGDLLYLYTDGVTEALDKKNNLYSEERLQKAVSVCKEKPVQDMVLDVLGDIKKFVKSAPQADDITILALRYFGKSVRTRQVVRLKNDLIELKKLAKFVDSFCINNKISIQISKKINLVLDEIVTNIISYAYEDDKAHEIDIVLEFNENEILVKIEDDGKEFNPLEIPEPDIESSLEDREIGGLGVFFVKDIMDNIKYKRKNQKNSLVMRKKV
jgi:phosphoserine phosphatase RsbU/P